MQGHKPTLDADGHIDLARSFGSGGGSALRAVIPPQLTLDICLAAEVDLEEGAMPIASSLF